MSEKFPHIGFRVCYDGKPYSGFQRQVRKPSVQAELERALITYFGRHIRIDFSSRTDAGVHAYDQVVMIRDGGLLYDKLEEKRQRALLVGLNGILPDAVRIRSAFRLRSDYHPKRSPLWKEYSYTVLFGPCTDPLRRHRILWYRKFSDSHAVKRAMKEFVGTHNFAAFSKRVYRYEGETERTILKANLLVKKLPSMPEAEEWRFIFRGTGFLHHMVRTMVGTLLAIGRGENFDLSKALRTGLRKDAGINAPGEPLCLEKTMLPRSVQKSL